MNHTVYASKGYTASSSDCIVWCLSHPAVKTTAELVRVVDVGVEVRLSAKPSKAFSTDRSTGESPVQYIRNFLAATPPMNNLLFQYYVAGFGWCGLRCA